jgi:hypothetical protein
MASQNESDTWDPAALARMISLDPDTPAPSPSADRRRSGGAAWSNDDLRVILRHQLSTRLESDLGDLSAELGDGASPAVRAMTFGGLLQQTNPSLGLLRHAKQFAKACKLDPDGPLPEEVATVLYFALIAAALLRCNQRISRLNDAALIAAMRWVLGKDWVDDSVRELMRLALAAVESSAHESTGRDNSR